VNPPAKYSSAASTLTGRVAVVTGGNGGIGLGIARALTTAGADVAIWARNQEKSAAAVGHLEKTGRRIAAFACDVQSEEQVEAAMSSTVEEFGDVDIMIANSGVNSFTPLDAMTLQEWHRVLNTNLTGTFLCFRAASRHLIERERAGALVAVASVAA
jgi:NAD(P)-dependent dehydrogenase (short-subunit alcohol dehydrogenase family)